MANAEDEYTSPACDGLDGTRLRAVGPIPRDPAKAWAKPDLPVLSSMSVIRGRYETEKRRNNKDPHSFYIITSEHGNQDETPEESIRREFSRKQHRLSVTKEKFCASRNTAPASTRSLLDLPNEVMNMIADITLEAPLLHLHIRTDTLPASTIWERPGMIKGIYDGQHEWTTSVRDEWLRSQCVNIPLGLVSRHFRNIVSSTVDRNWIALRRRIIGQAARVTFASSTPGHTGITTRREDPESWSRIGAVHQGIWYDLSPMITSRVRCLQFLADWDWDQDRLVTPLRDIVGFADEFERLQTIEIRCRILVSERKPSCGALKKKLYGTGGVYSIIVGEIAAVAATAIMNRKHDRCGIVPGCCLVPNCVTRRSMAARACQHGVPNIVNKPMRFRVVLLPIL